MCIAEQSKLNSKNSLGMHNLLFNCWWTVGWKYFTFWVPYILSCISCMLHSECQEWAVVYLQLILQIKINACSAGMLWYSIGCLYMPQHIVHFVGAIIHHLWMCTLPHPSQRCWRCQQWGDPTHPHHARPLKSTHGHEQTPVNRRIQKLYQTQEEHAWVFLFHMSMNTNVSSLC